MKAPRMWAMKSNSNSKFRATKDRNKTRIKTQTKKKKTISKWRATSTAICTPKKNKAKINRVNPNKPTSKWGQSITKREKKI